MKVDRDLLAKRYNVNEHFERNIFRIRPIRIFRQVVQHDLVFCWFASWHSFLPLFFARVMKKPSVLIIGGYDIAKQPEIGYGHQCSVFKRWLSRYTMNLAGELLTFSFSSKREALKNIGPSMKRVRVIHLGIPDRAKADHNISKDKIALSVGNVSWTNLKRKGHELFVKTAKFIPDIQFMLAGRWLDDSIEYLRSIASPNVVFTGWLEDGDLDNLYARSSVYIQLSRHEGFGMSVAESMLAGCIPVATKIGSLPEVIGDNGLYVDSDNPREIAKTIVRAFDSGPSARDAARNRILINFPLEKRGKKLYAIIGDVLSKRHG